MNRTGARSILGLAAIATTLAISLRSSPVGAEPIESFRVGSFNAYMKPSGVIPYATSVLKAFEGIGSCGLDNECRARLIKYQVNASGYDMLAFQEVFDYEARRYLLEGGDMAYGVRSVDTGLLMGGWAPLDIFEDSGLALLSRHPFVALPEALDDDCADVLYTADVVKGSAAGDGRFVLVREFEDTAGSDTFSNKAVAFATFNVPRSGGRVHVFFTHLQSHYSGDSATKRAQYLTVRRSQMKQVSGFYQCIKGKGWIKPNETVLLLGDLNINGDLSNPSLGVKNSIFGTLGLDRRHDRMEWDRLFHPSGFPETPGAPDDCGSEFGTCSSFQKEVQDQWLIAMTPWNLLLPGYTAASCWPTFLSDPAPICTVIGSVLPYPYAGSAGQTPFLPQELRGANFDRGLTTVDRRDDERIDYIFAHMATAQDGTKQVSQHLTEAANLFPRTHPFLSFGCLPGGPGCGDDPTSDHLGVSALIGPEPKALTLTGPNPTRALIRPDDGDRFRKFASDEVHWFRFDEAGSYTFQLADWTGSATNPPQYSCFEGVDLTHELPVAFMGEDLWAPPHPAHCAHTEISCDPADPAACSASPYVQDQRCIGARPAFAGRKVKVLRPPLYVKVGHLPNLGATGEYKLYWQRATCATSSEACDLVPYEGRDTGDGPESLAVRQTLAMGTAENYFLLHTDRADSGDTQHATVVISEPLGTRHIEFVELIERATGVVRAQILAPALTATRQVWKFQHPGGAADLESVDRWLVRVVRRTSEPATFQYWAYWETDLTYLHCTSFGGSECKLMLQSDNADDDFGHDEMWMNLVADFHGAQGWDLGKNALRPGIMAWNASGMLHVSDGFHEDGAKAQSFEHIVNGAALHPFGGAPFRAGAVRYVSRLRFEACEDDYNDDECGYTDIAPLGARVLPLQGAQTSDILIHEATRSGDTNYAFTYTLAHFIGIRVCGADADCPSSTGIVHCVKWAGESAGVCR